MRSNLSCLLVFFALSIVVAGAQGTAPTFKFTAGHDSYTLAGRDPAVPRQNSIGLCFHSIPASTIRAIQAALNR